MFSENVIAFCTEGLLGPDQEQTLQLYCSMMSSLTQSEISRDDLSETIANTDTVESLMLRDYPAWLQVRY